MIDHLKPCTSDLLTESPSKQESFVRDGGVSSALSLITDGKPPDHHASCSKTRLIEPAHITLASAANRLFQDDLSQPQSYEQHQASDQDSEPFWISYYEKPGRLVPLSLKLSVLVITIIQDPPC